MVKQLFKHLIVMLRLQPVFWSLPIIIFLLVIYGHVTNSYDSYSLLVFIGFWLLVFPAAAAMQQIGSLQQQELFISFPVSPFFHGFLYPLIVAFVYSFLFEIFLWYCLKEQQEENIQDILFASFPSALFLMMLTSMLISLFKNSGIGIFLALFYFFFGMFTGGAGQAWFYLMQWYRPKVSTEVTDFIFFQYTIVILFSIANYVMIKYRERFYILPL